MKYIYSIANTAVQIKLCNEWKKRILLGHKGAANERKYIVGPQRCSKRKKVWTKFKQVFQNKPNKFFFF